MHFFLYSDKEQIYVVYVAYSSENNDQRSNEKVRKYNTYFYKPTIAWWRIVFQTFTSNHIPNDQEKYEIQALTVATKNAIFSLANQPRNFEEASHLTDSSVSTITNSAQWK